MSEENVMTATATATAPEAPQFDLDFGTEVADEKAEAISKMAEKTTKEEIAAPEQPQFTAEEQKAIDGLVEKIDISNSAGVIGFGQKAQQKLSTFSEKVLEDVKAKDVDEVGDMLTDLIGNLGELEVKEEKGIIAKFFKKHENNLEVLKAKYSSMETNIDQVQEKLETHQVKLMKDVATLDQMYTMNLQYYKELTMYIAAGKAKLEQVRNNELKTLNEKAAETGLPEDAQAAKDFADKCDRFEKKIYDLELTRTIALQTGPQIRMIQQSDTVLAEKIQSTIVNTIPLWKNQVVIAIGINHAAKAAEAERTVNDMTNELLKKNADNLKIATVSAAKEAERGIVDIETLKHTNETLIQTMDEVLTIQKEGKEKRRAAEAELSQIENQLRTKMLEASKASAGQQTDENKPE